MTRVVIFGGRDWDDQAVMDRELDLVHSMHRIGIVINGGQTSRDGGRLFGADWQASVWASACGIPVEYFYANWKADGKAAGPIRNQRMVTVGKPDLGVQFPGGKGTRDMRRRLDAAGIPVIEISSSTT